MYTYRLDYLDPTGNLIASYQDPVKKRLYHLTNPPQNATHWQLTQQPVARQLEPVPSGFYGVERIEE